MYILHIKDSSASLDQVPPFYGVDTVLCLVFAKTAGKFRVTLCFNLSKRPMFYALASFLVPFPFISFSLTCS